jgi:UDPglucose--hexose-1-phosphate uridylyltransferase
MPELRKDPILDRWVIIAAERGKRPNDFIVSHTPVGGGYCPFCGGNEASTPPELAAWPEPGRGANGPGWTVRVVPNKYPALASHGELDRRVEGLYERINGLGRHEIVIETPSHDLTLPDLPVEHVEQVFLAFRERIAALSLTPLIRSVVVFKNHGPEAGATIDHSHSQIVALPIIPRLVHEEFVGSRFCHEATGRCVWCDLLAAELAAGSRVVMENDGYVAFCPYASRFPFEVCILPKAHGSRLDLVPEGEFADLAAVVKGVTMRMNALLDRPAWNMVLHQGPFVNDGCERFFHWHLELFPVLTRVAGFEWGSGIAINPTPPEEAARFFREGWHASESRG